MFLPFGFYFKDCLGSMLSDIPFVKSEKPIFFLDTEKKVQSSNESRVLLPFVINEVFIKDVHPENIESKYQEYEKKMSELRFECLYKLVDTGLKNTFVVPPFDTTQGKGVFFYFLFLSQTAENNSMVFTEKFSAAWSTERIIAGLDSCVTFHEIE